MARLSDADQDRLPLPGFDPRRPAGGRSRAVHGPRGEKIERRNSGVALLLFQEPDAARRKSGRARSLSAARDAAARARVDEDMSYVLLPAVLATAFFLLGLLAFSIRSAIYGLPKDRETES